MHARLTICDVKPGAIGSFLSTYNKSIIPETKKQKGFKGAHILIDRKSSKVIAMTMWASEEDLLANEKSGYYNEQLTKWKPFIVSNPVRAIYEVGLLVTPF